MDPTVYNPKAIPDQSILELLASIEIPAPAAIEKLSTQGAYHLLYVLQYSELQLEQFLKHVPSSSVSPNHPTRLLLRVSGNQVPHTKTENECALIAYITKHRSELPVPNIVHFDSSTKNPIGHEYQLMTVCPGVEVDSIFRSWDKETKDDFLDQVIALLRQLHSIPVQHMGGFAFSNDGEAVPGPGCEEFNWQQPGLDEYWGKYGLEETPDTINALGPYQSWTELNVAWLKKYIYAIGKHPLMEEFRGMIPLLQKFIALLEQDTDASWRLNDMRILLTHRDLHFGNMLYDVDTKKITGVIDWEFAGAAAFCKWDPPRAFLASQPYDEEGIKRKRGWVQDFKNRCEERNVDWRTLIFDDETGWSSEQQRSVYQAMDRLRCVFEVAPLGNEARAETVRSWAETVKERLEELGIK